MEIPMNSQLSPLPSRRSSRQTSRMPLPSKRCSDSLTAPLIPDDPPCVITTFPKCPRPSKCRYAALASANGNTRSITGRKRCSAMARFIASKSARLPTLIAPTVMPRPVSNKGSSIVPEGDRLAPIRLTCPPTAKGLQRFRDRSRSADLDDAIDAAAIGQFARRLVPIRRLGVVDHVGGPQRLEPLGLLRGRGCRDHSGAQGPGKL